MLKKCIYSAATNDTVESDSTLTPRNFIWHRWVRIVFLSWHLTLPPSLPPPPSPLPPPPPDSDTVTKSSWRRVGGELNSATDYIIYYGQLPLVLQLQHLCIVQLHTHMCWCRGGGTGQRERESGDNLRTTNFHFDFNGTIIRHTVCAELCTPSGRPQISDYICTFTFYNAHMYCTYKMVERRFLLSNFLMNTILICLYFKFL